MEGQSFRLENKGVGGLLRQLRKEQGMSQLELGLSAGVSARHISFIENGRSGPSRNMVIRLADTLDLGLAEKNSLLVSAGFAPLHHNRPLNGNGMEQVRNILLRILENHEPYPALVMDGQWNILLVNGSMGRLLAWTGLTVSTEENAGSSANIFLSIFDPEGLRPFVVDWERVAVTVLRRARREAAARNRASELHGLIEKAESYPGVPDDWRRVAPVEEDLPVMGFSLEHRGQRLSWISTIATFGTPQDITVQDLQIESFFPADEETEIIWSGI